MSKTCDAFVYVENEEDTSMQRNPNMTKFKVRVVGNLSSNFCVDGKCRAGYGDTAAAARRFSKFTYSKSLSVPSEKRTKFELKRLGAKVDELGGYRPDMTLLGTTVFVGNESRYGGYVFDHGTMKLGCKTANGTTCLADDKNADLLQKNWSLVSSVLYCDDNDNRDWCKKIKIEYDAVRGSSGVKVDGDFAMHDENQRYVWSTRCGKEGDTMKCAPFASWNSMLPPSLKNSFKSALPRREAEALCDKTKDCAGLVSRGDLWWPVSRKSDGFEPICTGYRKPNKCWPNMYVIDKVTRSKAKSQEVQQDTKVHTSPNIIDTLHFTNVLHSSTNCMKTIGEDERFYKATIDARYRKRESATTLESCVQNLKKIGTHAVEFTADNECFSSSNSKSIFRPSSDSRVVTKYLSQGKKIKGMENNRVVLPWETQKGDCEKCGFTEDSTGRCNFNMARYLPDEFESAAIVAHLNEKTLRTNHDGSTLEADIADGLNPSFSSKRVLEGILHSHSAIPTRSEYPSYFAKNAHIYEKVYTTSAQLQPFKRYRLSVGGEGREINNLKTETTDQTILKYGRFAETGCSGKNATVDDFLGTGKDGGHCVLIGNLPLQVALERAAKKCNSMKNCNALHVYSKQQADHKPQICFRQNADKRVHKIGSVCYTKKLVKTPGNAGGPNDIRKGDCWNNCLRKDGHCPSRCGSGYCCRKGRKRGGCSGKVGGNGFHQCSLPPLQQSHGTNQQSRQKVIPQQQTNLTDIFHFRTNRWGGGIRHDVCLKKIGQRCHEDLRPGWDGQGVFVGQIMRKRPKEQNVKVMTMYVGGKHKDSLVGNTSQRQGDAERWMKDGSLAGYAYKYPQPFTEPLYTAYSLKQRKSSFGLGWQKNYDGNRFDDIRNGMNKLVGHVVSRRYRGPGSFNRWHFCANEDETCYVPKEWSFSASYGHHKWRKEKRMSKRGNFKCNNGLFGDPRRGKRKRCFVNFNSTFSGLPVKEFRNFKTQEEKDHACLVNNPFYANAKWVGGSCSIDGSLDIDSYGRDVHNLKVNLYPAMKEHETCTAGMNEGRVGKCVVSSRVFGGAYAPVHWKLRKKNLALLKNAAERAKLRLMVPKKTTSISSAATCQQICDRDPRCKSFAVDSVGVTCDLFSKDLSVKSVLDGTANRIVFKKKKASAGAEKVRYLSHAKCTQRKNSSKTSELIVEHKGVRYRALCPINTNNRSSLLDAGTKTTIMNSPLVKNSGKYDNRDQVCGLDVGGSGFSMKGSDLESSSIMQSGPNFAVCPIAQKTNTGEQANRDNVFILPSGDRLHVNCRSFDQLAPEHLERGDLDRNSTYKHFENESMPGFNKSIRELAETDDAFAGDALYEWSNGKELSADEYRSEGRKRGRAAAAFALRGALSSGKKNRPALETSDMCTRPRNQVAQYGDMGMKYDGVDLFGGISYKTNPLVNAVDMEKPFSEGYYDDNLRSRMCMCNKSFFKMGWDTNSKDKSVNLEFGRSRLNTPAKRIEFVHDVRECWAPTDNVTDATDANGMYKPYVVKGVGGDSRGKVSRQNVRVFPRRDDGTVFENVFLMKKTKVNGAEWCPNDGRGPMDDKSCFDLGKGDPGTTQFFSTHTSSFNLGDLRKVAKVAQFEFNHVRRERNRPDVRIGWGEKRKAGSQDPGKIQDYNGEMTRRIIGARKGPIKMDAMKQTLGFYGKETKPQSNLLGWKSKHTSYKNNVFIPWVDSTTTEIRQNGRSRADMFFDTHSGFMSSTTFDKEWLYGRTRRCTNVGITEICRGSHGTKTKRKNVGSYVDTNHLDRKVMDRSDFARPVDPFTGKILFDPKSFTDSGSPIEADYCAFTPAPKVFYNEHRDKSISSKACVRPAGIIKIEDLVTPAMCPPSMPHLKEWDKGFMFCYERNDKSGKVCNPTGSQAKKRKLPTGKKWGSNQKACQYVSTETQPAYMLGPMQGRISSVMNGMPSQVSTIAEAERICNGSGACSGFSVEQGCPSTTATGNKCEVAFMESISQMMKLDTSKNHNVYVKSGVKASVAHAKTLCGKNKECSGFIYDHEKGQADAFFRMHQPRPKGVTDGERGALESCLIPKENTSYFEVDYEDISHPRIFTDELCKLKLEKAQTNEANYKKFMNAYDLGKRVMGHCLRYNRTPKVPGNWRNKSDETKKIMKARCSSLTRSQCASANTCQYYPATASNPEPFCDIRMTMNHLETYIGGEKASENRCIQLVKKDPSGTAKGAPGAATRKIISDFQKANPDKRESKCNYADAADSSSKGDFSTNAARFGCTMLACIKDGEALVPREIYDENCDINICKQEIKVGNVTINGKKNSLPITAACSQTIGKMDPKSACGKPWEDYLTREKAGAADMDDRANAISQCVEKITNDYRKLNDVPVKCKLGINIPTGGTDKDAAKSCPSAGDWEACVLPKQEGCPEGQTDDFMKSCKKVMDKLSGLHYVTNEKNNLKCNASPAAKCGDGTSCRINGTRKPCIDAVPATTKAKKAKIDDIEYACYPGLTFPIGVNATGKGVCLSEDGLKCGKTGVNCDSFLEQAKAGKKKKITCSQDYSKQTMNTNYGTSKGWCAQIMHKSKKGIKKLSPGVRGFFDALDTDCSCNSFFDTVFAAGPGEDKSKAFCKVLAKESLQPKREVSKLDNAIKDYMEKTGVKKSKCMQLNMNKKDDQRGELEFLFEITGMDDCLTGQNTKLDETEAWDNPLPPIPSSVSPQVSNQTESSFDTKYYQDLAYKKNETTGLKNWELGVVAGVGALLLIFIAYRMMS